MKFKISVSDFQYAMRLVRGVSPTTGTTASLAGVLITAENGLATFVAHSPMMLVKVIVKVETTEEGEACVEVNSLASAISSFQPLNKANLGTADITVSSSTVSKKLSFSTKTKYQSGKEIPHKRVFKLMAPEFFPTVPAMDVLTQTLEIPAEVMMDATGSVSYAVSSDAGRLVFTCVLLSLSKGKLTLFATDGVCLAEATAAVDYDGPDREILIPGAFATKISKSFFDSDILSISIQKGMVFVSTPNLILGGRLVNEEYPDYRSVLAVPTQAALVDKNILLDNLVNLTYEASAIEDTRVIVCLKDGEASLVCGDGINLSIPAEYEGEFTFHCNLKLFVNSVRNVVGDKVKIGFVDSIRPLHFTSPEPSDKFSFNCILVPLAVR